MDILYPCITKKLYNTKTEGEALKDVDDKVRWAVLKAMLEDFPSLRKRCREYLHDLEERGAA